MNSASCRNIQYGKRHPFQNIRRNARQKPFPVKHHAVLYISLTALLAMTPYGRAGAAATETEKAVPAGEFLNSLGVVTHLGYDDGRYSNAHEVVEDLNYLGIHQLREGLPMLKGAGPEPNLANSLAILIKAGNRFDFITEPAKQSLSVFQHRLDLIAADHTDAVIAVEGPNEINNQPFSYKGLAGEASGRGFQRELYGMIKADHLLKNIPVYYFTGGRTIDLKTNPGLADYANAHPYPNQGQAPGPRIASEFRHDFAMSPPYPRVITETGYFDRPTNPNGSGVDDATQCKLTLDLLLDAFQQGISKTFIYQLRSAYPDPRGDSADIEYGLFNFDNSPKPVATAIHDLTAVLMGRHAQGSPQTTAGLAFALANLPATGHHLLMQKTDGTFMLVVWAEPPIWNEAGHAAISATEVAVTLTFPAPVHHVRIFDPLASTVASETFINTSLVRIGLSDHPLVLEIQPSN